MHTETRAQPQFVVDYDGPLAEDITAHLAAGSTWAEILDKVAARAGEEPNARKLKAWYWSAVPR